MQESDQQKIERSLQPFQKTCRQEGFTVQCVLVPKPFPDHEAFRDFPPCFQLKVIEPNIRNRHYLDTWILFRRLLRETVDREIRNQLCDFNIYPTLEAANQPLPPIPHLETTQLFNRLLYIMYWAFVSIRNLAADCVSFQDEKAFRLISRIADGLHNVPHDMFFWGYGNDASDFSTFDFIYSDIERLDESNPDSDQYRYLHFLEMPYEQFLSERLRSYNGRQTGIIFDPDRSAMQ